MTIPENTDDFASEFKDFLDCFVVVGGTPSALYMEQRIGFNKATKDLDIVILEKGETERSKQFFSKLKKYIEDHGYKSEELKSGKRRPSDLPIQLRANLSQKRLRLPLKDKKIFPLIERLNELKSLICLQSFVSHISSSF